MIAKELISDTVPPLKLTDTGKKALEWMHEFCVASLPVTDGNKLIGIITEDDILDFNQPKKKLNEYNIHYNRFYVSEYAHIYEVIKAAAETHEDVVPVLNSDEEYLGAVTNASLVRYFAEINSLNEPGAILVLEVENKSYSLAEIARITESNDVKVLCSYVVSRPETSSIEVTLKLDKTELSSTIATFERFDYKVKASYKEKEYTDDLKDRYNAFMKYMNV